MGRALFFILLIGSLVRAHPLLELSTEERVVYDFLESSPYAEETVTSIKPYTYEKVLFLLDEPEFVKEYLNALSPPGFFLKPVNTFSIKTFYTSEEDFVLPNSEGLALRKGFNLLLFLDGYLSLGERAVIYYSLRSLSDKTTTSTKLHKLYFRLKFWKLAFTIGKDSVHLGPGEYALLLSSNAPPFPMVKLETAEPFKFLGKWEFIFLRGWLEEEREDRDNPNILALRIVWKPWDLVEIGATRTALYGGEGRPGYKLTEYPTLILGTKENIPYSKYDADGYGALDVSIYLPVEKWTNKIKVLKLYFQDSGTDITAWWQEEDRGEFKPPFGFQFLGKGTVAGILLRTEKDVIRLEYTRTSDKHYTHHLYPMESYTYRGFYLGHPYGRSVRHIFLKHRRFISPKLSVEYMLGFYEQPAFGDYSDKMKRYYLSLSVEKRFKAFILESFLRLDLTDGYNESRYPNEFRIVDKNKTFFTLGVGISRRF
ncbi:MAG: capsule assembly Wzi family protein [Aquificae bacterium]|nr:capsule assembly Wzi family protein [Aquificota bacterium]